MRETSMLLAIEKVVVTDCSYVLFEMGKVYIYLCDCYAVQ